MAVTHSPFGGQKSGEPKRPRTMTSTHTPRPTQTIMDIITETTTSQEDDNSSVASESSTDSILNMVPFSQRTPEKNGGEDDEEVQEVVNESKSEEDRANDKKRKYDDTTTTATNIPYPTYAYPGWGGNDDAKFAIEKSNAKKAFDVTFAARKVGSLHWRIQAPKKGHGPSIYYPVRLAQYDETVGLNLPAYDSNKKCPIEYIQYPHKHIKGHVGQFDLSTKKQLTPYYGQVDDSRKKWNVGLFDKYALQLKRTHKGMTNEDFVTENLYLQLVLDKSLAEAVEQERLRNAVDTVAVLPPLLLEAKETLPSNDYENEQRTSSDSDNDIDNAKNGSTSRRETRADKSGSQDKTEPLRVGDRIAYFPQQGTAGQESDRREATVLNIDPKGPNILTIDDAFTNLQPDHLVLRIARLQRGKLVPNDNGQWRSINKFILKKEGDPDAYSKVFRGEKASVNEMKQRLQQSAMTKMKEDGFCLEDVFQK